LYVGRIGDSVLTLSSLAALSLEDSPFAMAFALLDRGSELVLFRGETIPDAISEGRRRIPD
jgi:hypothetical protein